MRTVLPDIVIMLALSGLSALSQPPQGATPASDANAPVLEDFKPSSLNQPGQTYPQVNSQNYVRFRIAAPNAQSVSVTLGLGGGGGTRLAKDTNGVWVGTTAGPMDEGFHYYHLSVDGGVFNDPGTLNFYGSTRWESGVEVPAHDADFYALKDVPHGGVQLILFPSKNTNGTPVITPCVCLYAARLRREPRDALPGALFTAWLG